MKKKLLVSLIFPLLMTSCASTETGVSSGIWTGNSNCPLGNVYYTSNVVVNQGVIQDISFKATYSPMVWARVADADLDKVETIEVENGLKYDGTLGTLHFAKYIQIGDMQFTGSLRDSESDGANWAAGEYIKYRYNEVGKDDDALADLNRHLNVADAGTTNYMSNVNWYVESVLTDNIKILAPSGETFVDSGLKPSFYMDTKDRSLVDDSWSSSVKAVMSFIKDTLKKINFKNIWEDADGNQHQTIPVMPSTEDWTYNVGFQDGIYDQEYQTITGCKVADFDWSNMCSLLTCFNNAYARVEYESF